MSANRRNLAGVAGTSLTSLPDELLVRCLSPLDDAERLRSVALVSRRFSALCSSPALLHTLSIDIGGARTLTRAEALPAWLQRHAAHIRDLTFRLRQDAGEATELAGIAASCMTVMGTAGQLERLKVHEDTPLATTAWLPLPGMRTLHHLALGSVRAPTPLAAGSGIHLLTRLQKLELAGRPVVFDAGGLPLPASLTHLSIKDPSTLGMPAQIATLSNLCSLELVSARYSASSMDGMSRLHSLTYLDLVDCSHLPGSLEALTGLRQLVICRVPTAAGQLDALLPQMQQLTYLALGGSYTGSLAALTALTQLESVHVWLGGDLAMEGEGQLPHLPAGAWLGKLRYLSAPWPVLANSMPAIFEAKQLRHVTISTMPRRSITPQHRWRGVWDWAAQHPPLHKLTLYLTEQMDGLISYEVFEEALCLARRRPGLTVSLDSPSQ